MYLTQIRLLFLDNMLRPMELWRHMEAVQVVHLLTVCKSLNMTRVLGRALSCVGLSLHYII